MKVGFRLFCFDMDGTLIRNTNSVRYLCVLNGREKDVLEIEEKEDQGQFSWIEADYLKAAYMKGLRMDQVVDGFQQHIQFIHNIDFVIKHLKKLGIQCILVTAGPIQVAALVGERFGFDQVYGSYYEVDNNVFTGRILEHFGEGGKLKSLFSYCRNKNISLKDCITVGDGDSDLDVFEHSGKSIAINYSESLIGKADVYIRTEDLKDILQYIA
ncbi:HAD family hydrolase [Geosporobacter ferrireducens]|uniref:phosphoserine phosphatase n=1 Tax=Geosporobacter ferrireducens TaxID=1424294 RepID=A0A1D8GJZ0_9FIRM|nr:HAD family phosphatase [Geosporobacter ferrireducens]AOT71225.1 haloacid dehalogenase [Geosporobacter ferrireducens]MTI58042.1 HAD-IB family phosphatase [Geosporobacter ferrireducens]